MASTVPYIAVGPATDFTRPLGNALNQSKQWEHQKHARDLAQRQHELNVRKDDREQALYDKGVEFDTVMSSLQLDPNATHMGANYQRSMQHELDAITALEKDFKANSDIISRQRGYFNKDGTITDTGKKALQEHKALLASNNFDTSLIESRAFEDLKKVWNQANSSTYLTDQQKRIDARKKAFDIAKSQAPSVMSLEEYTAMAQKKLADQGYDRAYSQDALAQLINRGKSAGLRTRKEIIDGEHAILADRHKRKVEGAKILNEYYKNLRASGTSSPNSSANKEQIKYVNKIFDEYLDSMDFVGNDEKMGGYAVLSHIQQLPISRGVDKTSIQEAIMESIQDGVFDDLRGTLSDATANSPLMIQIANKAKKISDNKNSKGYSGYIDKKDFVVGNYNVPLDSTILGNRFSKFLPRVRGGGLPSIQTLSDLAPRFTPANSLPPVQPKTDPSYTEYFLNKLNDSADTVKVENFDTPDTRRLGNNSGAELIQSIRDFFSPFDGSEPYLGRNFFTPPMLNPETIRTVKEKDKQVTQDAREQLVKELAEDAALSRIKDLPTPSEPADIGFLESRRQRDRQLTQEAKAELARELELDAMLKLRKDLGNDSTDSMREQVAGMEELRREMMVDYGLLPPPVFNGSSRRVEVDSLPPVRLPDPVTPTSGPVQDIPVMSPLQRNILRNQQERENRRQKEKDKGLLLHELMGSDKGKKSKVDEDKQFEEDVKMLMKYMGLSREEAERQILARKYG